MSRWNSKGLTPLSAALVIILGWGAASDSLAQPRSLGAAPRTFKPTPLYYPQLGAIPLRFATLSKPTPYLLSALPSETHPLPAKATNSAAPATRTNADLASKAAADETPQGADEKPAQSNAPPVDLSAFSPAGPPPASEMLIVTPQMLAEYLKPTARPALPPSTNAPAATELQFTPPEPKAIPGSEARYKTQ